MNKNYFPNRDKECFSSALANLLVEIGDKPTAKMVYDNFPKHPFVLSDGVIMGVTTRLLVDLTGGRYQGVLYAPVLNGKGIENIKKHYRIKASEVLKVIREEREKGRIRPLNDVCERLPRILFHLDFYHENPQNSHAIVDLGNDKFITNGKFKIWPSEERKKLFPNRPSDLYSNLDIVGILDVWTAEADPDIMASYR